MVMIIQATVNKSDYDNMLRSYWRKFRVKTSPAANLQW